MRIYLSVHDAGPGHAWLLIVLAIIHGRIAWPTGRYLLFIWYHAWLLYSYIATRYVINIAALRNDLQHMHMSMATPRPRSRVLASWCQLCIEL